MFNFGKVRPTVLLIDDDLVSREVMATVLTMHGYAMHTAENGARAVAALKAGDCAPEVILMDAQMPGLNGTKLMAALRAQSRARIFAISGSSATDEVMAAADGFLLKPFGAEELGRALTEPSTSGEASQTRPDSEALDHEPVICAATLAELRGMMAQSAVREIYAAVVADLGKRQCALEAAMAAGDAAQVRRIGHAIKGGCGMAGAAQAARLGARLEALETGCGGDHLGDCAVLLGALRAATDNLRRMLEAEFPRQ
jgi:CheY-like chemotaxis protein